MAQELELSIEAITTERDEGDIGTTPFYFEVTRAGGDTTLPLAVDYELKGDISAEDIDGG